MQDRYESAASGMDSPAIHGFAIVPNDVTELAEVSRALYVGATGAVCARLRSGSTVTLINVAAGTILPIRATHVLATGTTAQNIVGLV